MNIEVLKENATSRELKVVIDDNEFNKEYNKELNSLSKKAHIDGFRKGKIPLSVIEKRFGKSVRAEITEKMINKYSSEHLQSVNRIVISKPEIDNYEPKTDGSFSFSLKYEFLPEFSFTQHKDLEIPVDVRKITDEYFENYINNDFLKRYSTFNEVTDRDILQDKDVVFVDMTAVKNGEKVENFTKTDTPLEIGKGDVIGKDFDAVLIGKKIGDTFTYDYKAEGENTDVVTLTVTLKKIKVFELPKLDDEFVNKYFAYGRENYTVETFKQDLRNEVENQAKQEANTIMVNKYVDTLVEQFDAEIPKTILEMSKEIYFNRYEQKTHGKPGHVHKTVEQLFEENKEEVIKNAKRQIVFVKLKEIENIHVEEADIYQYIDYMSKYYGLGQQQIEEILGDKQKYQQVIESIQMEKINSFIIQNNKMVEAVL